MTGRGVPQPARPIRVLYDGEAFMRHARGGIPRYLAELIGQFRADSSLGVEPVTPYRWVASRHLVEHDRRYTEVPLPRSVRLPVLRQLNARRLRTAAAADEPDIAHHTLYEPSAFSRWPGQRRVSTVYDFMLDRFPELMAPGDDHLARVSECLQRSDAVICISETTRADLHRFHPGFDKPAFAVPLGVSDVFFDPPPTAMPALPQRYVLFVGNRAAHKNVDVLLRAFAERAAHDHDLYLVLVGAYLGSESRTLSELGIADRTLRLRVSDRQLPWVYRRAAVLVYTTLWEGFGLPVVEAMASGCPAVIADVDALTEVGGEAVRVFDHDDPAGLAAHIEEVIANTSEAERMRRCGMERARRYTWRRTAELTAQVYETVMAG